VDDSISVTKDQLADAFTEWDRRYREEPERFKSEAEHLLKETPYTYGQEAAPYLIEILREQGSAVIEPAGPSGEQDAQG